MKAKTDKKHVMFAILALLTTMVVLLLAAVPAMAGPVHLNRDAARGFVGVDPHTPRHILDQIGSSMAAVLHLSRKAPIPTSATSSLVTKRTVQTRKSTRRTKPKRQRDGRGVEEATETDEAEEVDEADDSTKSRG